MADIYPWAKLAGKFEDALILGNGASIAIGPGFSYSSLFENAAERGLITENIKRIFRHLETEDFELVLRMLWHAFHINKALDIEDNATSATYGDLRTALVKAVRDIHVAYDDVKEKLLTVAGFMRQFATVVSLNYDFLVYWAMLVGNREWEQTWFKDCFIHGKFDHDWEQYREPYGIADGSTLVFYPHGNLVLATDILGEEVKLVTGGFESLLDTIIEAWEGGDFTPLFVSEGTTDQKLRAISRSSYLNSVYNSVLPKLGNRIVIFGWAMSDNDAHITSAVAKSKPHAIAVSVRTDCQDLDEHCAAIEGKLKRAVGNDKLAVVFFDAASAGCWANP